MRTARDEDSEGRGQHGCKNWISHPRKDWEASHWQERYIKCLGGVFQGAAHQRENSELKLPKAGIDEVRVEMLVMAEDVGARWTNHVLKVLERILDGRIRRIVECEMEEEQQGFRRRRGTADGMFTLRQLVEKKPE